MLVLIKFFYNHSRKLFLININYNDFAISADFFNKLSSNFFLNKNSFDGFQFIDQKKKRKDFYKKYDALVFKEKKIPIRKNVVHDYFNALTWLAFPNSKKNSTKKILRF